MVYSFDSRLAVEYGVDEAIFLHNLYYWIVKNEANGRHFYDGKSWTYNSMKAFTELFPFWSKRQVERIINSLKAKGAIYVGNYNSAGMDRTQWYALNETVYCIYANGDIHFTESLHSFHKTVTPIPNSKPNSKPDSNNYIRGKFTPPTEDEVRAYCKEIGSGIDPVYFVDYYTSKGWTVGKSPMKDWRATVRNWSRKTKTKELPENSNNGSLDMDAYANMVMVSPPKYRKDDGV